MTQLRAAARVGARMLCRGEALYPPELARIDDAPPLIWVCGNLELLRKPMVAMVGARNASSVGTRMAQGLARELGAAGYVIVSGLARGIDATSAVMQRPTILVMEFTPFGVFALIAWVAGTFGFDALIPLSKLVLLNYLGCGIILLVVYPAILRFIAKLPTIDFYRGIIDAQAVAFSTASSNATLPVTLRCVQRNLGVSKSISSFAVALGATVNMNGTAMYLGLATLFGVQVFGVDLSMADYITISILGTLGAIGAAGIPGAGLIMMSLVLSSIGVPLETIAFVAGINHLLDMMRTMTNVTGDAVVAVSVGRLAGEIDVEEYISADAV